jgi:2-keto-3-deoxy-L-rhamnonate aldolase RhmA
MRFDFSNSLRQKLKGGAATFGFFITMQDATVTEIAADAGVDWVCIDMEHGSLGFPELLHHLQAARGTGLTVLVRVPTTSVDYVKRALDLGAHGVVLPLIGTVEQLREGFQFARFPPHGVRGVSNARVNHNALMLQQYLAVADEETMVIPIIETVEASRNIDSLLAVEGLEAIFFGPADLSMSYGHRGLWEGPGVAEDILRMNGKAQALGIATAIMCLDEADMQRRITQGFKVLGVGSDVTMMLKKLQDLLGHCKGTNLELAWQKNR